MADFPRWQAQGLEPWKARVRALWPETASLLDTITAPEQMVMARYDHHTLALPFGRKLVFIGDSAHSTSPQLGQGANMALLDVLALTQALQENTDLPIALDSYARKRRLHVKLYQALSQVFTPFYQSDSEGAATGAGLSGGQPQPPSHCTADAGADCLRFAGRAIGRFDPLYGDSERSPFVAARRCSTCMRSCRLP